MVNVSVEFIIAFYSVLELHVLIPVYDLECCVLGPSVDPQLPVPRWNSVSGLQYPGSDGRVLPRIL